MFVPTKFHSAEDKAWFGNNLVRFIAGDFPESQFTDKFYRSLSNSFGHIAHYSKSGFFGHFFSSTAGKIEFIEDTIAWRLGGRPEFTFSDVEQAVRARVREAEILFALKSRHTAEVSAAERAELERLTAKYAPQMPVKPAEPVFRRDLFDLPETHRPDEQQRR
jgi:hypothetical protein